MAERPIIFNGAMVRAVLDGRKTQTRRVVKRIPWRDGANPHFTHARAFQNAGEFRIAGHDELTTGFRCPYGQPGDRLWVRETHFINDFRGAAVPEDERADTELVYAATDMDYVRNLEDDEGFAWRPSIHMPRWACRLVLEITDVRIERLHAGDGETAFESRYLTEGINRIHHGDGDYYYSAFRDEPHPKNWGDPFDAWRELWTSTGGDWDSNPWVWVVEFRRAQQQGGA